MRVYLAGAIFGQSDASAKDWRAVAREKLERAGHTVLDPMVRDYRGSEDQNVDVIVQDDLNDIGYCDGILAMALVPSWGTAMEIFFAHHVLQIPVVAIVGEGRVSPWLQKHAGIARDLDQGIDLLLRHSLT